MALRKNNQKDYNKFADTKKDVLGNDRKLPQPNPNPPSDTTRVSDKYKVGDYVDEYEFEEAFQKQHDGKFPQFSVQDYSKVQKDDKGNYVVPRRD